MWKWLSAQFISFISSAEKEARVKQANQPNPTNQETTKNPQNTHQKKPQTNILSFQQSELSLCWLQIDRHTSPLQMSPACLPSGVKLRLNHIPTRAERKRKREVRNFWTGNTEEDGQRLNRSSISSVRDVTCLLFQVHNLLLLLNK